MEKSYLAVLLTSLILLAYATSRYSSLAEEFVNTNNEFASSTLVFTSQIKELQTSLADVRRENSDLNNNLQNEKTRNDSFAGQIGDITSKVVVLDKLSKTDPQLLQKYSKVYFLNEHYVPVNLTEIDAPYVFPNSKNEKILSEVWPYLKSLLLEASNTNLNLQILSAYRSFGTQSSLKSSYQFTYGAKTANQFSADQGYSEHQLGTTIDFTTPSVGAVLTGFEKTKAYDWLVANAHRFGFTLSYPEDNSYYEFEPWHWRFVGVILATKIHNENIHFYDLDQRVINQYLINLF